MRCVYNAQTSKCISGFYFSYINWRIVAHLGIDSIYESTLVEKRREKRGDGGGASQE